MPEHTMQYQNNKPLTALIVEALCVTTNDEKVLLRDINFSLDAGDVLGLIGETGAGKTVLIDALGKNSAPSLQLSANNISYALGDCLVNITDCGQEKLQSRIWGKEITFILSNARSRFSPIMTVGEQFRNILKSNLDISDQEAHQKAKEMFALVQMPDPEQNLKNYPHELSGGMVQRVEIAIALSMNPQYLLADEPTMGLDVTVQRQILDLMDRLFKKTQSCVVLATRDLGIAANYCNKVAVLFQGEIIEFSDVLSFFQNPQHPYSRYLLQIAFASNDKNSAGNQRIYGSKAAFTGLGCFCNKSCTLSGGLCLKEHPPLIQTSAERYARCHMLKPFD